ncbi:MAG: alpha/beta fold hydrolase [Actinomycetota bacterium]
MDSARRGGRFRIGVRRRCERRAHAPARARCLSTALLLAILCGTCVAPISCGPGKRTSYRVEQGGVVVGSQVVTVRPEQGTQVYSSVERRPFMRFDTTTTRRLELDADLKRMRRYYSNSRVPGAAYRTYIESRDEGYAFLENGLQTFFYQPQVPTEGAFAPLEADSACLLQALAARFTAANVPEAIAYVMVPSRSPVVRQVHITSPSSGRLDITGEGLPKVELELDRDGTLVSSRAEGGVTIERGSAGALNSKPYSPSRGAYDVREVRLTTGETTASGERQELAGSLYLPGGKSPYPAVVLEADYGPQDRTGCGLLSRMADGLARRGFAVLTCDRQGIPESEGDFASYTLESESRDFDAKVQYLFLRGDIDPERIYAIGHGQGGLVASQVAYRNPYVSACVLLATPSVRMFPELADTMAVEQGRRGALLPQEVEAELANTRNLVNLLGETEGSTAVAMDHTVFLDWMRTAEFLYPPDTMRNLAIPVLVVQGTDDEVVPAAQAEDLMTSLEGRGKSTQELALFEGLGHELGPWVDEAESRPYRSHPEPDPAVVEKITDWLKAQE